MRLLFAACAETLAKLRSRPSHRRRAAFGLCLVVPATCVGVDWVLRGPPHADDLPTYLAGVALSALVWLLCMEAARHRRPTVRAVALTFLGFTAACGLGLQALVQSFTHAYLGRRALLLAIGLPAVTESSYVAHYAVTIALVCLIPAVLVVLLARARHSWLGPSTMRLPTVVALGAALSTSMLVPLTAEGSQNLPPDILWLHGTGGPLLYVLGLAERPKALPQGDHQAAPAAARVSDTAPSILLILGESVRRDAVCLQKSDTCTKSPVVDGAAPERLGFSQVFSVATCTELASASLFTGKAITTPPDELARAPLLWDYARARAYRTAYLTSQNLLFQQMDQFIRTSRIDLLREGRDRVLDAQIDEGSPDEALTDEVLAFLEADAAPAFVVAHYANTHAPYRQVAGFTPNPGGDRWPFYLNSLVFHDHLVGDLVQKIRQSPRAKDTIVVYTSDHGEAWGEHGPYYHSFDLYAEQLDIPLWIDAPPGALSDDQRNALRGAASRPTSTVDISATVLDLLGALPAKVDGHSLLGPQLSETTTFLWNCPPMRECATDAFGVVRFPRKLHWVGHRAKYACHDLETDPVEQTPLEASRCADLKALLDETFGARP